MTIKFRFNKKHLFWILNIGGWTIFSLLYFIFYGPEKTNLKALIKFFSSNFVIPFTLTVLLRFFYLRYYKRSFSILQLAILIMIFSTLISFIWYFTDIFFASIIYDFDFIGWFSKVEWIRIISTAFSLSILMLAWSTLYYVINISFEWQNERSEKEKALLLATKAKMEMLKNQINPHFLFNALNSISALIDENTIKAQQTINELSDFLRYTLINKDKTLITLRDEIKVIEHFVQIQKIRFEEKLDVGFSIDPKSESAYILASILYPLVENAIKHGINTSPLPLRITIGSEFLDKNLTIYIENTGKWINNNIFSTENTNTGISNVKERMFCAYGSSANLEIIVKEISVCVQITIPTSFLKWENNIKQ